jgi:Ca2+-transporting ATPase
MYFNKIIDKPYLKEAEKLMEELASGPKGLKASEVDKRLEYYGLNELPERRSRSLFNLIIKQFKSGLVLILFLAALISYFAGEVIDSWVIIVVIIINAGIGFSQEYRAEKAISSLKKMILKTAKVLRDGHLVNLDAKHLVPGDIIILEEGDQIPADARIIEARNFRCIEAALTGESLPISKTEACLPEDCPLADQKNMVWKATFVAGGYAHAVVTGSGENTAIGDISIMLEKIKEKRSNFLQKTDVLAKQMSIIAIGSAGLLFLVGYFFRGFEMQEILLTSIAALVAAVPEGLPAVLSIVLAIGANRMAKRNAIVREFTATETLGAVSAILCDKTGTLTQNSLTVRKVFIPGESEIRVTGEGWFPAGNFIRNNAIIDPASSSRLEKLLRIAGISNNSEIHYNTDKNSYELIGDPTEGALLVLARKGEFDPSIFQKDKLDDLAFDSKLKLRVSLIKDEAGHELFLSGAPEELLKRSSKILGIKGETELSRVDRSEIQSIISDWSNQAMRVIALSYKKTDLNKIDSTSIDELVFVGLAGMLDPPRPETKAAVEKCRKAGIRVIMLTGDHVNTAVAVAKACGIIEEDSRGGVIALSENQLESLNENEFEDALKKISVFARLTPAMKLKIAAKLQNMGYLIAMTGDGVNDAPALKQADVGISMGIMGTDIARESSDVVLADDNFATIVKAVEQGRIIFSNSRQTSIFLVTTNIAESITLIVSIALGFPLPLTATQLLWLNLVTDGVNDMALATEPGHGDIMDHRTFEKQENILNKEMLPFLFINVFLMVGLSLLTFSYYKEDGLEKARTGVFMIMAFTQLFNIFNLRSINESVFKIGLFSNRYINLAIMTSLILLLVVSEVPFIAYLFHFQSIEMMDLAILFGLSSSVLWAGELYKFTKNKGALS